MVSSYSFFDKILIGNWYMLGKCLIYGLAIIFNKLTTINFYVMIELLFERGIIMLNNQFMTISNTTNKSIIMIDCFSIL